MSESSEHGHEGKAREQSEEDIVQEDEGEERPRLADPIRLETSISIDFIDS